MMIHLLRMRVSPANRIAAVRTIAAMTGLTRSKSGCISCDFYAHVDNDDELQLVEKWDSTESLKRHIGSEQYGLLLEALELAIERPEVEFHTVTTMRGLPYVEEIRLSHETIID